MKEEQRAVQKAFLKLLHALIELLMLLCYRLFEISLQQWILHLGQKTLDIPHNKQKYEDLQSSSPV